MNIMFDILHIVFDIFNKVFDILNIVFDILNIVFDILNTMFDILNIMFDIINIMFDIMNIMFDNKNMMFNIMNIMLAIVISHIKNLSVTSIWRICSFCLKLSDNFILFSKPWMAIKSLKKLSMLIRTSISLVYVSDKIINNGDNFGKKCLFYGEKCNFVFSFFCFYSFYLILEKWENFFFPCYIWHLWRRV